MCKEILVIYVNLNYLDCHHHGKQIEEQVEVMITSQTAVEISFLISVMVIVVTLTMEIYLFQAGLKIQMVQQQDMLIGMIVLIQQVQDSQQMVLVDLSE